MKILRDRVISAKRRLARNAAAYEKASQKYDTANAEIAGMEGPSPQAPAQAAGQAQPAGYPGGGFQPPSPSMTPKAIPQKPLTEKAMAELIQQARGDKVRARDLARQQGYYW